MKSMKIEINDEQPLDEVVKELERLGYEVDRKPSFYLNTLFIRAYNDGSYDHKHDYVCFGESTTLQQLREMK